jgi:hypothetical protein
VVEVHSAIHVCTGQRHLAALVDTWLTQHSVPVTTFGDVFSACVYLLKNYERVPDLALVGADWLSEDELGIVSYVRQTWPRAGAVVYGAGGTSANFESVPYVRVCHSDGALRAVLATSPHDVLASLYGGPLTPTHAAHALEGRPKTRVAEGLQPRPVWPAPAAPPDAPALARRAALDAKLASTPLDERGEV